MFENERDTIQGQILDLLSIHEIFAQELKWTWIPFSGHWGISTSFFEIAAKQPRGEQKINVRERAMEIADLVQEKLHKPKEFEKIESVNGYLNIYFNSSLFAKRVVDSILEEADSYGQGTDTHKRIMVEYSQPNTHKAFHVGHLRNMVLGGSICNILEFAGNKVVRANYLGDIGLHVIKWLWNYLKFHAGEEPPKDGKTKWMGGLYAEASKRIEENPAYEEEIRALFKKWDEKQSDIVDLWQKTRQWSLEAFDEVYAMLGMKFDKIYFESEVEELGKEFVDQLIENGIATDERPEGAVIVNLDKILGTQEKYRVLVILRSDGTSLYATKDIPLAIKKFNEFDLDQSIYVIDVRQSLYLKQIFKLLEIMGYAWAKNCHHLSYEIVNLPGNVTIASREGTVVLLEDLIEEARKRAAQIVLSKNPDLPETKRAEIAKKVAIGAIKYQLLSRDNTKVITFDWEAAMDVNGQAAPYIQYAAVRANSILRKVHNSIPKSEKIGYQLEDAEIQLIDLLARFPREVQRASDDYRPLLIANYAYDLSKSFSNFYNKCHVLGADEMIKNFRLRLVSSAKQVIVNSLYLLGIEVPDVM